MEQVIFAEFLFMYFKLIPSNDQKGANSRENLISVLESLLNSPVEIELVRIGHAKNLMLHCNFASGIFF